MTRWTEALAALNAIVGGARASELESETLEFKQPVARSRDDTVKRLVEAALCLANARGGVVVLGVRDDAGGRTAIVGSDLEPEWVKRRIHELTRPALLVDTARHAVADRAVLLITVPQGVDVHGDQQGRAHRRIGTDCVPMTSAEQARLREERMGYDWSSASTKLRIADIVPASLDEARRLLRSFVDERRKLAQLSDHDLLRALRVTGPDGNLLRAGAVLFCAPDEETTPAIVYQYRATPGGEPRLIRRLAPPLLTAYREAMSLFSARQNQTPVNLPDGQQIQIEDFPELAVREALANALIHRDYRLIGPVVIEHSPEVFVTSSPGPLVSGITPENILTHPSKPRNPCLAHAARVLGLAEEVGRGVDRMFREMIRSGRDIPRIDGSADQVRVTFVGGAPKTQIARFIAQLPERERDDTDALLVLFGLCHRKTITAKHASALLQKSPDEAEATLRRLASDDVAVIEPTRATVRRANPSYRLRGDVLKALGAAVPYQRRTVDEIDRKVIDHLREYDTITNRTIRNMLDVGTQRARDILKDLVRREVIIKTSVQQRGPKVEYGRGPRFPAQKRRGRQGDAQLALPGSLDPPRGRRRRKKRDES